MKRLLALAVALLTTAPLSAQTNSLQDLSRQLDSLPNVTVYPAKEIITLDPSKPKAEAVAVVGDRILAVGTLDELKAAAGNQPVTVNTSFADHFVVPGFIAQHDHPMLAALTMTSKIIAIEDWVLPQGTSPAAKNRVEYLKRLTEQGIVLMAGRTLTADERTFGIAVLVAPSDAEARAIMNNDPAVSHGVMRAELFPFRVALWSTSGPPKESDA